MKTLLIYLLMGTLAFGLMVNEASAKRFGAGRSFGVQRSHSSLFSSSAAKTKTFGRSANTNRWGGVIGGLLVGGLLASLFMGHGLGAGLLSWIALGLVAFFIVSFLRKRMQPGFQSSGTPFSHQRFEQPNQFFNAANGGSYANNASNIDEAAFLREAKVTFLRLQTAYDQKNIQDLREFTAPEVYAEIEMQLNERGDALNQTDVTNLNAELLDMSNQAGTMMASVRFTGLVKENDEPQTTLNEIWHFRQFQGNAKWVVGGIQQEVYEAR